VKKKKKQTAHSPTTFHQFFLFILSLVSSNLLLPYRKPVERSTVSSFSLSIRVVLYIDGLVLSIYTGSVPLPPHLHWYDTVVDIIFSGENKPKLLRSVYFALYFADIWPPSNK
jgi:phage terminase large subunit